MLERKSNFAVTFLNILLFGVIIIIEASGFINLSIGNASPLLFLPLLTAYSIHSSVGHCAIAGFILGACRDSVTTGAYCFNTIIFICLGVGICLAANNLFNKNLKAMLALSIIASVIYYLSYFFIFHFIKFHIVDSIGYLIQIGFPSAAYSAVLVIPLFFVYRFFEGLK